MKHFFSLAALFMLLAFSAQTHAQDVLGCTVIYAPNYNPEATVNDGSCTYDVVQLLSDGYCIGELVEAGIYWQDFQGVSYEGGVIVHVNVSGGQALICDEQDLSGTYEWGCYGSSTTTSCNSYNGYDNTIAIVTGQCPDYPSAAQAAYTSTKDGYTDWFLPSYSEYALAESCPNWDEGFSTSCGASNYYWTSSAYGTNSAYQYVDGYTGSCSSSSSAFYCSGYVGGTSSKNNSRRVRLMRYVDINANCGGTGQGGACADWQYDGVTSQAAEAGVDCTYDLFQCNNIGDGVWNSLVLGVYPATTTSIPYGLTWERDLILNVPGTYDYLGNTYDVVGFEILDVAGVPTGLTSELSAGGQVPYNQQTCLGLSGDVLEEGSYTIEITGTMLLSVLGNPYSVEGIVLTHQIEVTPNTDGIPGCIYDFAGNFNPIATYDDGSCVAGSQGPCPGDLDGDQLIGVGDILSLLSLFNSSCN